MRRRHKDAGAGDAEDKNRKRVVESEVVAAGSGLRAAGCGLRAAGCGLLEFSEVECRLCMG